MYPSPAPDPTSRAEPVHTQILTAQQQLALDIYKELVEINTVTETGDTGRAAEAMAARLRATEPLPIIGRVEEGRVLLDLRTVFPEQDAVIVRALVQIASAS